MRLRDLRALVAQLQSGEGGGVALEDIQAALEDGTISLPTDVIQAAIEDGTISLPAWRGFKHAGPIQQSFWNSWDQDPDSPALFRRVGSQVQLSGLVSGGVAAPGNALIEMPDDVMATAGTQDFSGDLRVSVIDGHTYVVMVAGNRSVYDLSSIIYNAA